MTRVSHTTYDPIGIAAVMNEFGVVRFDGCSCLSFKMRFWVWTLGRYVTALNNLGDAYEKKKNFKQALETYKEALNYAPGNKIATSRVQELQRLV